MQGQIFQPLNNLADLTTLPIVQLTIFFSFYPPPADYLKKEAESHNNKGLHQDLITQRRPNLAPSKKLSHRSISPV
jgi:hypothetical protein